MNTTGERVVIDRINLVCRGTRDVTSAQRFVEEVVTELERELETSLPSREDTIVIPRIDLDTTVRGQTGSTSSAVAKAIARAITSAAASSTPSAHAMDARSPSSNTPSVWASSSRLDAHLSRLLSDGGWTTGTLGRFVRAGHLPLLLSWLDAERARSVLDSIARELGGPSGPGRPPAAAIDVFALASAAIGVDAARKLDPSIASVVAIAWTARLGSEVVRGCAAWRATLTGHRPRSEAHGMAAAESGPSSEADTRADGAAAPSDQSGIGASETPASDTGPDDPFVGLIENALPALNTRLAGCAFLAVMLDYLGWDRAASAIRGSAQLLLHDVILEAARATGVEAADGDPAPWMLAGLLAAPLEEDLAVDGASWSEEDYRAMSRAAGGDGKARADVLRAWTRAAAEDLESRIGSTTDVDVAAILGIPGTLRSSDDEVVVTMPFTPAYESLLRAGLLVDHRDISWLAGRCLRFEFEEIVR